MSHDPKKTGAAHDPLIREPGNLERFRCPHFRSRSDPREWHVRQHPNNRVRHAAERDAAPDNIRIAAHPLAPEGFGHHRDVSGFFFVRQKGAPPDRTHAQHIEIVRRHLPTEDLHRLAECGQRECGRIFRREAIENRLTLAKMLKPRH